MQITRYLQNNFWRLQRSSHEISYCRRTFYIPCTVLSYPEVQSLYMKQPAVTAASDPFNATWKTADWICPGLISAGAKARFENLRAWQIRTDVPCCFDGAEQRMSRLYFWVVWLCCFSSLFNYIRRLLRRRVDVSTISSIPFLNNVQRLIIFPM